MNKNQFKSTSKQSILIVDFNAGNLITHHLNYVLTYAKFFSNYDIDFNLALPKNCIKIEELAKIQSHKILKSRYYRLNDKKYNFYMIWLKIVKTLKINESKLIKKIESYLETYYLYISFRSISKLTKSNSNVVIFFPSVDVMALKLATILTKFGFKNRIILRINQLENFFNDSTRLDIVKVLSNLLVRNPNILIGCETKILIKFFRKSQIPQNKLYWAPLPFVERKKSINSKFYIGFLGSAKERKGFESIPEWLEKFSKTDKKIYFYVQGTKFPWLGYTDTLERLISNPKVEILPDVLSNEEFFLYMSKCNIVVLPYDKKSYKWGGSSLFFYAADFSLPVFTLSGLPFSAEVREFNCGLVIQSIEEIPNHMKFFTNDYYINGINNFNEARITSNLNLFESH